jgi:O-antigen ligase
LLAVTGVGLILINQRSTWIAFAVAGLACLVMSGQIRRVVLAMVPIALAATIVALIWGRQVSSVFDFPLAHLLDASSGTGADRIIRWRLAWEFFLTRPFNDWVWSWRIYLVDLLLPYPPHNFVLQIAVTEGVAGLAFCASVFWTGLRGAWSLGRRDAEARALVGWLIVAVVFLLLNASYYLPTSIPLLVAALAALASRLDWLRQAGVDGPDSPIAATG